MILDLPYWALTTPAAIWRATMESFGRKDFEEPSDDFYNAAVEAIREISEEVEEKVNRRLIVRQHTQQFRSGDWACEPRWQAPQAGDGHDRRTAYFDQWPGVQIDEIDGDAALAANALIVDEGGIVLASTEHFDYSPTTMLYFAGYRRPDQIVEAALGPGDWLTCGSGSGDAVCEELTDVAGLADLAVMPPLLPGQFARTIKRLVIFELREQIKGLPGFAGTRKTVEGIVIESLGAPTTREAWRASELKKLLRYKRTPRRTR